MSQFEYLSVLVSIIIGLALTQLLSGAARLIQRRRRIRVHAATLCWMLVLFLVDIQVWWVAFERRGSEEWEYFSFLLYLLIPVTLFLLNYLVLPDLDDQQATDLAANFDDNRGWFFGLLTAIPLLSLTEQFVRDGVIRADADVGFRVAFAVAAMVAARVRSARFQFWIAITVLGLFLAYVATLFMRLQ